MLPFTFEYHRAQEYLEAVKLFSTLREQNRMPIYYGGGTEIITLGRLNLYTCDAVIDIKSIPMSQIYRTEGEFIYTGSARSLTSIERRGIFPLLEETISRVADRTARNKITIGGNACGKIFYREGVLPFLLTDSYVLTIDTHEKTLKYENIHSLFNGERELNEGQLVLLFCTPKKFAEVQFFTKKRRQQWNTGYPLITIAGLRTDGKIRMALSGLLPYPFRDERLEAILNDEALAKEEKISRIREVLPEKVLDDQEGSSEYRLFVLEGLIEELLEELEGGGK
ncbi:FAD binding domain-containing protein [Falsibacillus pallidus]|uniref:CO/xanthine dehydrogenase FAD-binding subunit n=1 Tax=Falsibacillus pallidus TaxID=493781 RepID=A0A370GR93_9BACI|nr:FAD binding domain-containing protein [Falsibacillus pallidus]RDI45929.1 CO/xanthine dehydrogenase FAD-binding subunit [Falsibacillus pallidus]